MSSIVAIHKMMTAPKITIFRFDIPKAPFNVQLFLFYHTNLSCKIWRREHIS